MTKFKQFLVPAVIILMGAGAAFATNAAKDSDASDKMAYLDSSTEQCVEIKNANCTTTPGVICTWTDPDTEISHEVRQLDESGCSNFLYRP